MVNSLRNPNFVRLTDGSKIRKRGSPCFKCGVKLTEIDQVISKKGGTRINKYYHKKCWESLFQ